MTGAVPQRPLDVMVAVGTDHHRFDRMIEWVEAWARAHPDRQVFVQSGTSTPPTSVPTSPYLDFDVMAAALHDATVVVCHGGAATMIEVRRAGHLPIVVARDPSLDEHVDDHQQRHTQMLADRGEISLPTSAEELAATIDAALADPAAFRVVPAAEASDDVVLAFGAQIEDLVRSRRR